MTTVDQTGQSEQVEQPGQVEQLNRVDQSGKQLRSFLSDRPVEESSKDYLWTNGHEDVSNHIQRIARHIVDALQAKSVPPTGKQSDSMTFAVYGKWGLGKSSALHMLIEQAKKLAEKQKVEQGLHFYWYNASHFEAIARKPLLYDAYSTLAFTILNAAGANSDETWRTLIETALRSGGRGYIEGQIESPDKTKAEKVGPLEQRVILTLSRSIKFDEIVKNYLKNHVLVILVDDLDRCQESFIREILNAIQSFNAIENIFFVLAVDRARLEKAIQEQTGSIDGPRDPDYALEKYVQLYVSLPDMDQNILKNYINKLKQDTPYAQILAIIEENIELFSNGLHELTPRSVKRFINTEDINLDKELKQQENQKDREQQRKLIFKRILLKYSWPHFANEYFDQTTGIPAKSVEQYFIALEQLCYTFRSDRDTERLNFELKRLANHSGITEWGNLDVKLARYLGLEPFWLYSPVKPEYQGEKSGKQIEKTENQSGKSREITRSLTKKPVEPIEELLEQLSQLRLQVEKLSGKSTASYSHAGEPEEREEANLDTDSQFRSLYVHSQAAADDRELALPLARRILKFVRENRQSFNAGHAPRIGNVAIDAEKFGEKELADQLYRLALELNPENTRVMHNYVDFIINSHMQEYYETAGRYLAKLKTGEHAQYEPERTQLLSIRLARLTGKAEQVEAGEQELGTAVKTFSENPTSRRQFGTLLSLMKELGEFEKAREIAKAYYDHAGDITNQYVAVRSLADVLAESSESEDEFEAMDAYRFLLDGHLDCDEARADLTDMQHNYAFLLYKHDYDNVAGSLWFEAYKQRPAAGNVRRIYSDYLMRAGRADLAAAVIDGKPLDEMILVPAQKKLPEHFSTEHLPHWWEEQRKTQPLQ